MTKAISCLTTKGHQLPVSPSLSRCCALLCVLQPLLGVGSGSGAGDECEPHTKDHGPAAQLPAGSSALPAGGPNVPRRAQCG
jgi:hypothetical protein